MPESRKLPPVQAEPDAQVQAHYSGGGHEVKIIKRDGREVPYDYRKIKNAIEAANAEVAEADRLSDMEAGFIILISFSKIYKKGGKFSL